MDAKVRAALSRFLLRQGLDASQTDGLLDALRDDMAAGVQSSTAVYAGLVSRAAAAAASRSASEILRIASLAAVPVVPGAAA